ncbi:(deoxy)nucleoside triphosphate pyrophosphohydrolase [Pedobacter cryoconitis]|uniref:8-oxo-dGTP diphosphatase n=1 Tax=Pedobacter cryoconitis TaxID=188932 RepID=A0A7X0J3L4_9SPHI|nr:(deoxy)nucleoside triphosphate pyrophosphohydrolase [Pedobacter cryoconitis]MBB6500049.1 8-oxo-dGTP diphosphatase [Pedobacter cryoconitis]
MIDVSCALITDYNGQVLVTQRSAVMHLPLKWEFPGGKVEPGESAEACLYREIREELGVDIKILNPLPVSIYDQGDRIIRLLPFQCVLIGGEINLTEHAAFLWLLPEDLKKLDWAEADIPVVQYYLESLRA